MALSGSIRGASSLRTTTDRNILDHNFGNEAYSPEFDAYMSTDIGKGQKNYDNYYMNGLYTNMNVAKTSYHIQGRGNKTIFAVCRGIGDDDGAFEASRNAFEYLDEQREEILNAKSLMGIKKNLQKFADDCHSKLIKNTTYKNHEVSLLVVVYAFSGAVYLNCGQCSLFKVDKNNNCKPLLKASGNIGGSSYKCIIKTIPYFLNNNIMLTTNSSETIRTNKGQFALMGNNGVKERVTALMNKLMIDDSGSNHTCIMISENGSKTIMPSTKIAAVVCAVITAISIINMLVQGIPTA